MKPNELNEQQLVWNRIDQEWCDLPDETDADEELFDQMVAQQHEQYGDLTESCPEAQEILDNWTKDMGEDMMPKWREAVDRFQAKDNVVDIIEPLAREQAANTADGSAPNEESTHINDAEVLGVETPEMVELLQQDVVFMTGELWDQGDRRNTPAGKWKRNEMPWMTLLTADWSPLTKHGKSTNKQGKSIVLGETIDGNRNAESVKNLHAIVIDVDSGPKVDDVVAKLEKLGLFALVYTSFNHNKTKVVLKHDDVVRKMKLDDTPNRVQVIEYLRVHHKDRYDEDFLENIEIVDARKHGPKGLQIVLETPPLHKFRIVLPLQQPVELAALGTTATQWKDAWANIVTGFVVNELGVSFDSTSCDVNRLFYTPRPAEGKEWYCVIIQGKPLNVDDIQPHSKNEYLKNRDNDPFSVGDNNDDRPPLCLTPSGKSLNKYHSEYKDRFLITELLLAECPDKVRREVGDGKLEIECPFEHEHSTEGGTGTVVMSPEVNEHGVWTISCPHDACQGRHKLQFLEEMLRAEWFPEELLRDPEYLLGGEDEDDPMHISSDVSKVYTVMLETADSLPKSISMDDLIALTTEFAKRADFDENAQACWTEKVYEKTHLGKVKARKLVAGAVKLAKRSKNSGTDKNTVPDINECSDHALADWTQDALSEVCDSNGDPVVYQYQNDMADIQSGKRRMLTENESAAVTNNHLKYQKTKESGDVREVFAPKQVITHNYNRTDKVYPELSEVKASPYFGPEGRLILREGYDAHSETFLALENLGVPDVPAKPRPFHVIRAKRLLTEVICDFPLDGVESRQEIFARGLLNRGEPLPSFAHIVCLIIERAVRLMIDGPTPVYTPTKPAPGTGAGALIGAVTLMAIGKKAAAEPMPSDDTEYAKVMGAHISNASEYSFFDNMNAAIDLGTFASNVSEGRVRTRLLGSSRMIEAEVRHTWIAAANNIKGTTEILRRMVMIELDAKVANPEQRKPEGGWLHAELPRWINENRADLVWAVLVLVQNWIAKGMVPWEGQPKASFEAWSRVMGGILRDAGIRGFLENENRLRSYGATGGDSGVEMLMQHLASNHGNGTFFRAGGTSAVRGHEEQSVFSLMSELNIADDGNPLLLTAWGYNREDGKFLQSRGIATKFRDAARRSYEIVVYEGVNSENEVKYSVSFTENPDPKSPQQYYWVMSKSRIAE